VGGEKTYSNKGLEIIKKIITKKSKDGDFLILTLIHNFINFLNKNR
jgi:hypothetical protein